MILDLIGAAETPEGFTLYGMPGVREYVENLPDDAFGAVGAIVDHITKRGLADLPKPERVNSLGDKLFELKPRQIRLVFFYHPTIRRALVITHGFKKESQRTPPHQLKAAKKLRSAFEEEAKKGNVKYEG